MTDVENNTECHCLPNESPGKKKRFLSGEPSLLPLLKRVAYSRRTRLAIIALLPVLIFIRYPVDSVDYDMWWHMALGKYYITHHTLVMDHSVFSWTPTDPTWIYNTCLGSIAIYLFYTLAGGFGLWLFQWLVFLGVFFAFYLFLRLLNQRLDVTGATIVALIGVACSITCRYYKPELFSVLLFAWLAFVYFYVKVTRNGKYFYFLPLIFLLWVNFHGAFVIGLVVLGILFVGEILNRLVFPRQSFLLKDLFHFGCAMFLSVAALFINPYGVDYLISTYQGITSAQYAGLQSKYIMAWSGLWPALRDNSDVFYMNGLTAWIMTAMIAFVVVLSVYELIRHRSFDFAVILVSVALYWKGMETVRVSYFLPILFFFVFFYLVIRRLHRQEFSGKITLIALCLFLLLFESVFYFNLRLNAANHWFGSGFNEIAPVQEVEFLKKHKLPGQVFNDYVIGGYLMWALYPDYKVFIDPRSSPYRTKLLPEYMEFTLKPATREAIENFRKKYPFKIVIMHYRQLALIADFLSAGDDWRLLYFEKRAAVLIHKSLLPFIQTQLASIDLGPYRFNKVKDPDVLVNVFNFYVRINPEAAKHILAIYKKNISNFYKPKLIHVKLMEKIIADEEQKSRNKEKFFDKI
jgi:hypothetical protein